MKVNGGSEERQATAEIERYIVWPGQACAYMIGRIKILELRERAKNELGNLYDIKDFHHHVLMNGSLPLTVLKAINDKYIQEVKANYTSTIDCSTFSRTLGLSTKNCEAFPMP